MKNHTVNSPLAIAVLAFNLTDVSAATGDMVAAYPFDELRPPAKRISFAANPDQLIFEQLTRVRESLANLHTRLNLDSPGSERVDPRMAPLVSDLMTLATLLAKDAHQAWTAANQTSEGRSRLQAELNELSLLYGTLTQLFKEPFAQITLSETQGQQLQSLQMGLIAQAARHNVLAIVNSEMRRSEIIQEFHRSLPNVTELKNFAKGVKLEANSLYRLVRPKLFELSNEAAKSLKARPDGYSMNEFAVLMTFLTLADRSQHRLK